MAAARPAAIDRRRWMQWTAAACSGLPAVVRAGGEAAPAATAAELAEARSALAASPAGSGAVLLELPAVADDGAAVPVTITSVVPGTRELLVLVDVNPEPLALRFAVPEGTEPWIATRIRMAASGTVIAAARSADGRLHAVAQHVQVHQGGCA
jgi:sulfur-oxidizing protein SoxY